MKTYYSLGELTPDQFSGKEKIDGSLYLNCLESIPEGFNPTVGGSLNLGSLKSIPEGFNPTVGYTLYLKNEHKFINHHFVNPIQWQDGKYMLIDGILTQIINHRGNVYHGKIVGENKLCYIVTDGNGKWSHGDTLKSAKDDLIYKIGDHNKDEYKDLSPSTKLSFKDAVECYRVITGACGLGVRSFVQSLGLSTRKKYSIKQIIEITQGHYGHDSFSTFFNKQ